MTHHDQDAIGYYMFKPLNKEELERANRKLTTEEDLVVDTKLGLTTIETRVSTKTFNMLAIRAAMDKVSISVYLRKMLDIYVGLD
jgi:hypothetical protein